MQALAVAPGRLWVWERISRPTSSKARLYELSRQAVITPEGLEKLKEEIEHLTTAKRREVAERIKEARDFGDISENAEYDDAKNEQALLEGRIAQLEERLRRATVIDEKGLKNEEGFFRSGVPVQNQKNSDPHEIHIFWSTQAQPP